MEDLMTTAVGIVSSADTWLLAISGLLVALAGIAKLTKTKKDDAWVLKAKTYLDKVLSLTAKIKPKLKVKK